MAPEAHERAGSPLQDKAAFLGRAYLELGKLWDQGDGERFPWFYEELERIEATADDLALGELKQRLRSLYVQLRAAKGQS